MVEIEGNLDQRGIGDVHLLIDFPDGFVVLRRRTETPDGGQVFCAVRDDRGGIVVERSRQVQGYRQRLHL